MGSLTLAQAGATLGARPATEQERGRSVYVGPCADAASESIQAYWNGWTAGVGPARTPISIGRSDCVLAGVAAGALAVGQAFLAQQGDPRAGKAHREVSLWFPHLSQNSAADPGPAQEHCSLPLAFWLIGLGNLGQAYVWSLSMLPYPNADDVLLFLQDDDLVRKENWGTSVLVRRSRYGALKTRIAEEWATARRFRARRIDRRLDEHLRRTPLEPAIALAGLDRMPPRRLLGLPGFEYIIDAGLGATAADYQKVRVNVFDVNGDPAKHFEGVEDREPQSVEQLMQLEAYQELTRITGDRCGAATLAGHSVAVPFVSAFVGAVAVAQAVRIATGQAPHSSLVGDLADVRSVRATLGPATNRLSISTVQAAS